MAAMSDTLEFYLMSHIFGTGTFSKPPAIAFALCSGEPTDAMTGATIPELANAGAYARQAVTQNASNFTDPVGTNGVVYNLAAVTFPQATADWGWISGVAITSSATYGAGTHYIHGALTTPKLIGNGDQFIIPISGAQFTAQ